MLTKEVSSSARGENSPLSQSSTQAWHQRALHPPPKFNGIYSTGIETGCKPVLFSMLCRNIKCCLNSFLSIENPTILKKNVQSKDVFWYNKKLRSKT